jgi:CubicO group peptidase (beta-lactamase class C family)
MNTLDYAQETLLTPLGITRFSWEKDPQGIPVGGWGLSLSPRDMAKLGYLYLQDGNWDGQQIVSSNWVKTATSQHVDPQNGLKYGYQWWITPTRGGFAALGHAGQMIYVNPDLNLVIVTTADLDGHDPIFNLIDTYILPAARP